jgi:hypothetical protein
MKITIVSHSSPAASDGTSHPPFTCKALGSLWCGGPKASPCLAKFRDLRRGTLRQPQELQHKSPTLAVYSCAVCRPWTSWGLLHSCTAGRHAGPHTLTLLVSHVCTSALVHQHTRCPKHLSCTANGPLACSCFGTSAVLRRMSTPRGNARLCPAQLSTAQTPPPPPHSSSSSSSSSRAGPVHSQRQWSDGSAQHSEAPNSPPTGPARLGTQQQRQIDLTGPDSHLTEPLTVDCTTDYC